MIVVRVKLYGSIHDVVDNTRVELELSQDASLRDLLSALHAKYGDPFAQRILSPDGKLQVYAQIFVDGMEAEYTKMDLPIIPHDQSSADVEIVVVHASMGG